MLFKSLSFRFSMKMKNRLVLSKSRTSAKSRTFGEKTRWNTGHWISSSSSSTRWAKLCGRVAFSLIFLVYWSDTLTQQIRSRVQVPLTSIFIFYGFQLILLENVPEPTFFDPTFYQLKIVTLRWNCHPLCRKDRAFQWNQFYCRILFKTKVKTILKIKKDRKSGKSLARK